MEHGAAPSPLLPTVRRRGVPRPAPAAIEPAPEAPRFRAAKATGGLPGDWHVVDGFGVIVGTYLTERGATKAAGRLNDAFARALAAEADRDPNAEPRGELVLDGPTEADRGDWDAMTRDVPSAGDLAIMAAEDAADLEWLDRQMTARVGSYENAELAECGSQIGHFSC